MEWQLADRLLVWRPILAGAVFVVTATCDHWHGLSLGMDLPIGGRPTFLSRPGVIVDVIPTICSQVC